MENQHSNQVSRKRVWVASLAATGVLWLSQPPVGFWPLSLVAVIPWIYLGLHFANPTTVVTKRDYAIVWLLSTIYWLISLQGLRLAHPLMFIPWILFACYLALYHVSFVAIVRRFDRRGLPIIVGAPIAWVGLECIRNYVFGGISVLMLGHHVADLPLMIQIADLFGTYGVSFVLVMINVSIWMLVTAIGDKRISKPVWASWIATSFALLATIVYGNHRIGQPIGDDLATFALIQRSEPVEYEQSDQRPNEIFRNYAQQSVQAVGESVRPIDAVVWPESMFTANAPWRFVDPDARVPDEFDGTKEEFNEVIRSHQSYFVERARYLQSAMAASHPDSHRPRLLVGCAVVRYADRPGQYSGLVNIAPDGSLTDWYGKTHLVMFGEYIPIVPYIPGLRSLVPPGMGLETGPGAKRFLVAETVVAPNICIETAVEQVAVNQLGSFDDDSIPDVIVTVTNDGWFDDSSVIDHHLACAQLLAVGCRRPILSAANSGPTAWIDSCGRVVQRLASGSSGAVIATPKQDSRVSLYLRIGDWPARFCLIAMLGLMFVPVGGRSSA